MVHAEAQSPEAIRLQTIARHRTGPLIAAAFDIADRSGRTVYDCLYPALAMALGDVMVTADEKLVNSLAATPWAARYFAGRVQVFLGLGAQSRA